MTIVVGWVLRVSEEMMRVTISIEQAGMTLAALLRSQAPGRSWSEVRRLIETRHVTIDGELCLDAARRLRAGQGVELLDKPLPKPRQHQSLVIRHLDAHLVVVEKPAGLNTVRHPSERKWNPKRKALSPTLEDLLPPLIAQTEGRSPKPPLPRLRVVQRLDKETSGLLVFARSVEAERVLGRQFRRHTVIRRYLALVPGVLAPQRIHSRLIRDRGDGKRGSTPDAYQGKEAITHIDIAEPLVGYTLIRCRLETGRTHQIRIHLAELGHPVCGDKVYRGRFAMPPIIDHSGSSRLALHAEELSLEHPISCETLRWTMPLPPDLSDLISRLRLGKQ
jgi:23S rRNA pseudouridine1911/1915/1917 synthase